MNQPVEINAATELYARLTQQAALRQLSIMDLFHGATTLHSMQQRPLVAELYKIWIAFNGEHELLHAVYFNYGVTLVELRDFMGGINAFRDSIRLKPDFEPPYINLGRALEDVGHTGPAIGEWMKLINKLSGVTGDTVSHKLTVMHQTARVLESLGNDVMAEEVLRQSLDIDRRQSEAMQHWVSLRQRQCKWPVLQELDRVKRKDLLNGISTLSLANLTDDPMFQLAKAYHYARHSIGMPKPVRPHVQPAAGRRDPLRLRIGYVSSDMRDHAVGFAMTDVVEQHDRQSFEIFAYYCGINRPDATQARTKAGVDQWTDITGMTDDQAAAKIAADGVDILVDLNGYTKDARTKVFARRPAPVNVNWFGYPSTMGTPYHHYLIADDVVVPPEHEIYYSEKIVRLPCYQPNDRKRVVSTRRPTRQEVGLPENTFVFCSLNGMQKTTPITYDRWIAILNRVPNSVLWLLTSTPETNERLRKYASDRGIRPDRRGVRGKGGQSGPSRALSAGRPVPRQLPVWRAHHRVGFDVDGRADPDAVGPLVRIAGLLQPGDCGRHRRDALHDAGAVRRAGGGVRQRSGEACADQGEADRRPRHLRAVRHAQSGPPSRRSLPADVGRSDPRRDAGSGSAQPRHLSRDRQRPRSRGDRDAERRRLCRAVPGKARGVARNVSDRSGQPVLARRRAAGPVDRRRARGGLTRSGHQRVYARLF